MRKFISLIVILILLIMGIAFACLNHQLVHLNYLVGEADLALSLLLVCAFALGGIIGLAVGGLVLVKHKTENHFLRRKLRKMEKQI